MTSLDLFSLPIDSVRLSHRVRLLRYQSVCVLAGSTNKSINRKPLKIRSNKYALGLRRGGLVEPYAKEAFMSLLHYVQEYDAEHGIPRPMDAPHLTAYHAALRCLSTGAGMLGFTLCG